MSHLLRALAFAAHKHRMQRRKDPDATPYINHPIAVADLLANEAGITDEVVLIAAILHDTIEDTLTTRDELRELFGEDVAAIVEELTDDKSLPKETRKQLQIERAAHASPRARLVKLADKICNVRDLHATPPASWPAERVTRYLGWAKAVVDNLRGTHAHLEALFDSAHASRAG
jgi:GTP diphosphokinase / guanosine-3',5'-bis(diphosphate) 3'-diphosphatase